MKLTEESVIPEIDLSKCVGCGKCVVSCPRHIVELAQYDADRPWVAVTCANRDKGPIAMKECKVACIGCGLCKKKCEHEAITIEQFLAHIDSEKCLGCGECIEACPRHSIHNLSPVSADAMKEIEK